MTLQTKIGSARAEAAEVLTRWAFPTRSGPAATAPSAPPSPAR